MPIGKNDWYVETYRNKLENVVVFHYLMPYIFFNYLHLKRKENIPTNFLTEEYRIFSKRAGRFKFQNPDENVLVQIKQKFSWFET